MEGAVLAVGPFHKPAKRVLPLQLLSAASSAPLFLLTSQGCQRTQQETQTTLASVVRVVQDPPMAPIEGPMAYVRPLGDNYAAPYLSDTYSEGI